MKILKPAEIKKNGIKMLIYGQPGIGKTTTAILSKNPLLLDCDGGITRVSPINRCDTAVISKFEDITEVIGDETIKKYDTIVIDTIGKMMDFLTQNLIKNNPKLGTHNGGLSLQGYGALQMTMRNTLFPLLTNGKNVIFVAHETEDKSNDNRYIRPMVQGKTLGFVLSEMDLVGYMRIEGKNRVINFAPNEEFYAKGCEGLERIELPQDDGNIKITDELFNIFDERLEVQNELKTKFDNILNEAKLLLDSANESNINDVCASLESLPEIWSSKIQIREMLKLKLTELNLRYKDGKFSKI